MTAQTQILPTVPPDWLRAMQRAVDARLRSFRLAGTDSAGRTGYIVRSTATDAGSFHIVWVEASGKIAFCTNCPAQEHGNLCKHKGCVARRLIRERYGDGVLAALMSGKTERAVRAPRAGGESVMETARSTRGSYLREEAS